jgi:hypothetical protein
MPMLSTITIILGICIIYYILVVLLMAFRLIEKFNKFKIPKKVTYTETTSRKFG